MRIGIGLVIGLLALSTGAGSASAETKIAIVLDKGGKDDKSFNAAAYQGAMRAKEKFGAFVKYVEATDDNAYETLLRAFAQKDFDLIVAVGFAQADALKKVAPAFPKKNFAIVDSEVNFPNVRSLLFQEHEGSYLVGAIAAMTSKTGKVGFIGGMDIPLIRRFEMGFEAGVKKINPKAKLLSNYIGVTGEAWNNPAKAKELAVNQYNSGADVIYGAAGASNNGLFDAAEERKKLAIGVDSNQDWVKPGFILTSMLKRVDTAVFETAKFVHDLKAGEAYKGGTFRFGLANQGIDYSVDEHNSKVLVADVKKRADELKAQIIAGKITVPDFYLKKK
jgi:basic membrane protein A and related proteins